MSNWYPHFDVSICQLWLQVMERILIILRFWVFSYIIDEHSSCLKYCISTKLSQIVLKFSYELFFNTKFKKIQHTTRQTHKHTHKLYLIEKHLFFQNSAYFKERPGARRFSSDWGSINFQQLTINFQNYYMNHLVFTFQLTANKYPAHINTNT